MSDIVDLMHFEELPSYLTVRKIAHLDPDDHEGGTVRVEVESQIHVDRVVTLPTQFSVAFVNDRYEQFRLHVLSAIVKQYGLRPEPTRYS
jgi:hypothetical protein